MNIKIKYSIAIIGTTSWSGLGFVRGVNYYTYFHNKYENKKPYLYSELIKNGLSGIFVYINPILLPFTIQKELYRLEIDIRNLKECKDTDYYYSLL